MGRGEPLLDEGALVAPAVGAASWSNMDNSKNSFIKSVEGAIFLFLET